MMKKYSGVKLASSLSFLLALTLTSSVLGGNMLVVSRPGQVKLTAPETGIASYYGAKYHGRPTASGEVFDMNELTAAHPTLKFGTRVRVTHLGNNRSVTVRINDRGPFVKDRVIDLSRAAAEELKMIQSGLAEVKIEVVE